VAATDDIDCLVRHRRLRLCVREDTAGGVFLSLGHTLYRIDHRLDGITGILCAGFPVAIHIDQLRAAERDLTLHLPD
jgi:hypothetical protein